MKYTLEVLDGNYWEKGFEVVVKVTDHGSVTIEANAAGFISLAKLFLLFSGEDTYKCEHMHIDEMTGLEDGSNELIIVRS